MQEVPSVPGKPQGNTDSSAALVIADPSRLNAESVAWCLNAYGVFQSVKTVDSVSGLLNFIRTQRPAIVVISEALVVDSIREVSSELAVQLRETRVAVFADQLTDRQLDLVTNNSISGLLSRQEGMPVTCDQLTRIAAGSPVLSPMLENRAVLKPDGSFECRGSDQLKKLTPRQWDVLLRIAVGRRVPEVANELQISKKAVESHKHRIMQRLGTSDRVDLCRWAIREGLITA